MKPLFTGSFSTLELKVFFLWIIQIEFWFQFIHILVQFSKHQLSFQKPCKYVSSVRETCPGPFVDNLENASFFEAFESFVTSSKSSFAKVHHSWEHFLRRSDWLDWTSSDGLLGVWKIFWPENIWEDVEFNGASLISANKVCSLVHLNWILEIFLSDVKAVLSFKKKT